MGFGGGGSKTDRWLFTAHTQRLGRSKSLPRSRFVFSGKYTGSILIGRADRKYAVKEKGGGAKGFDFTRVFFSSFAISLSATVCSACTARGEVEGCGRNIIIRIQRKKVNISFHAFGLSEILAVHSLCARIQTPCKSILTYSSRQDTCHTNHRVFIPRIQNPIPLPPKSNFPCTRSRLLAHGCSGREIWKQEPGFKATKAHKEPFPLFSFYSTLLILEARRTRPGLFPKKKKEGGGTTMFALFCPFPSLSSLPRPKKERKRNHFQERRE